MKLVICAGDMGLSCAVNMGALKAIDDGVVTSVKVFLDMPGTANALEELKKRPWITVTWQPQPPVEPREDLYKKWSEDIERCIRIYGCAPFAAEAAGLGGAENILKAVCDQYGIHCDYHDKYAIREYDVSSSIGTTFDTYRDYDPLTWIRAVSDEGNAAMCTLYPGFLDDLTLNATLQDGDSVHNIHRIGDVLVLCSDSLKDWILDSGAMLVSLSDVIRQKHDYQNRLKANESPLALR